MRIPDHVAIIMDGNGRWARGRGMERLKGHDEGAESVRECIRGAIGAGVKWLTLYAFSTENWNRPTDEVEGLMELFCESVVREAAELRERGVRVRTIGDRGGLSEKVRRHLEMIERETAAGERLTVVLAINYSGRDEMKRAVANGGTEFENCLDTAGMPDPDLIIRTGGEMRLSNFLLWQAAYAELYFTDTMWPDFNEERFAAALEEYARRERRYGKI